MIISILESYRRHKSKDVADLVSYYPRTEEIDENGKKKMVFPNAYNISYESVEGLSKEELQHDKCVTIDTKINRF